MADVLFGRNTKPCRSANGRDKVVMLTV
ncbi:hypothetical protein CCACVL1_13592 [Corchorus capsularis]|uniref:Uncharacterized protein n=1 Tax=Corchorus capsularis TaxID=210143 RepID=A0A1R3IAG9_COCAP|nr:hypothetical protein CCACVL1_13592 [Corchorus capsularis]